MCEVKEIMLVGLFCEGCGVFIDANPKGQPQKCEDCFENELIAAVENNIWPDGVNFSVWQEIRQKYSEPVHAVRE